jgi:hypothetical protein
MKKSVKKYGTGGSAKSSSLSKYQMKGEVKKNDPIPSGMAARKKAQEQANADKIKKGIDSVVKQTPTQARAFDKKKSQMAKEYDNNNPGIKYFTAVGRGVIDGAKGAAYAGKEAGKFVGAGMKKMGEALGAKKKGGSVKKKK